MLNRIEQQFIKVRGSKSLIQFSTDTCRWIVPNRIISIPVISGKFIVLNIAAVTPSCVKWIQKVYEINEFFFFFFGLFKRNLAEFQENE